MSVTFTPGTTHLPIVNVMLKQCQTIHMYLAQSTHVPSTFEDFFLVSPHPEGFT